jgi:GAF domain-containing protein
MFSVRHDALVRLHEVMTRINAGQDLDEVLQAIADGVTEVSGFEVAAINVLRANGEFEVAALGGNDESIADMLHGRFPSEVVLERNERGEAWGMFRFLPHTVTGDEEPPAGFRVLDFEPIDHPDAWHPLDELSVALRSPTGQLIGIMYVDRPGDGLRPSPETIEIMELFAVQAGFAINHAQQRERLGEQVWLAGMVRSVIETTAAPARRASDLDRVLGDALTTLRVELNSVAAWLHIFPTEDPHVDTPSWGGEGVFTVSAALESHGPALARESQHRGGALVVDRAELAHGHRLFTPAQRTWLLRAFELDDVLSLVLVPFSLDDEVVGQLVLTRSHDQPWTDAEAAAVRDVGRELGWAIGRDRSRRREALATEAIARAREEQRELIEAIAEEVSPSLSAIDAYLIANGLPSEHPARAGMEKIWGLFNQVTTLAAFERPEHVPAPQEVDVTSLLQVQWTHTEAMATARGIRLLPLDARGSERAWADPDQLEWLMQVLLEDVIRTSPTGSSVRVSVVTRNDRLLVSCQISGHDDPGFPRPDDQDDNQPRWWQAGANVLLSKQGGQLSSRSGPLGRRVLSMSLPVPPATSAQGR